MKISKQLCISNLWTILELGNGKKVCRPITFCDCYCKYHDSQTEADLMPEILLPDWFFPKEELCNYLLIFDRISDSEANLLSPAFYIFIMLQ